MLKNGINVAETTVGVLGITFKENCPDVRNSKVIDIIRELGDWGVRVKVMDPWADANEVLQEYGLELEEITEQNQVDSIILAVSHSKFAEMQPGDLRAMCSQCSKPVIADLKSLCNRQLLEDQGFKVFRF